MRRAMILTLALCVLTSCTESHPRGVPISPDRREIDLSDAEYRRLCEWWEAQYGWPDASPLVECPGGSLLHLLDPDGCVLGRHPPSDIPTCDLRVSQWVACLDARPDGCPPYPDVCLRPSECIAGSRAGYLQAQAIPEPEVNDGSTIASSWWGVSSAGGVCVERAEL